MNAEPREEATRTQLGHEPVVISNQNISQKHNPTSSHKSELALVGGAA